LTVPEAAPTRPPDVGRVNWIDSPYNRWAFRHVRQLARTATIRRGIEVRALDVRTRQLDGIEFEFEGRTSTVGEMLAGTYTDALVVLHGPHVVAEQYFDGMRATDVHLLMSVSKSLTAVLAGVLVGEGRLETGGLVTDYLPELTASAWDGCTIQHLLDMRAGTDWDEDDYDDPDSHGRIVDEVSDYVPRTRHDLPPDTATWIAELVNARPHGGRFQYRSILTDVLAWVIEAVAGEPFADVFSGRIWAPIGAQHDAEIIVDNAGFPIADGGISCTALDLARFGLVLLEGGAGIVPEQWLARLRVHDPDLIDAYSQYADPTRPKACYHDMWWVADPVAGRYSGSGINGQALRIDHSTGTVIVKLSTWPDRWDDRLAAWSDAGLAAIAAAVA
jgi:CubicO group peptidase (beta-lactamase class C family)